MEEKSLWHEFNLGETHPAQGGGLMYCLRYDIGRINTHHETVVSALESQGVTLEDAGDLIRVNPGKNLNDSQKNSLVLMLEELSVLNDARAYASMGYDKYNDFEELKNGLVSAYFDLLEHSNIADAYNFLTLGITQIIKDAKIADMQNKCLKSNERAALKELTSFVKKQDRLMNLPGGFVLYGTGF
ncbi:hypothetical protein KY332_01350 [Candidatus Woesearchaeota archaeon]|nr:hypothetical protein [Candidatus Woesearchaeota archaeon]